MNSEGPVLHSFVRAATTLAQELAVEEIYKDFPYSCLGEAVRPIHGDELAAYALQLRQGHWCRW